jgi:hypothetical protein
MSSSFAASPPVKLRALIILFAKESRLELIDLLRGS